MARNLRYIGLSFDHPNDRTADEPTTHINVVSEDLKAKPVERIRLSEDDLVRLIRDASKRLAGLRGIR